MPTMINLGSEMLRISPNDSRKLEYSTSQGRTWTVRFAGSITTGNIHDLMDNGKELLATTDKGLFYSTNAGRTWTLRKRN